MDELFRTLSSLLPGAVRTAYLPALLRIGYLTETGAPAVVAVDGRCGSGKTRFAQLASCLFPCRVFHMDDFYLPFSARRTDWERVPAGNIDLERLRREVLVPARAGLPIQYRAFDCRTGSFGPAIHMSALPLTIVEGSYAHHPALAGCYDLKIFLTCSGEEQSRRLKTREGARFAAFANRWIPLEERYFRRYGIEACPLRVDTTGLFPDTK
ncbi:uridine kinase family protein [Agathobaculum sp.]|uniref:uridine kinase family protein n=1 Tax=Agathobaculum sp. TaxID=2048138 RepID=UPI002A828E7D|nr:uridine kinase [Agathobaculum sp.]MDY3618780.1 uridine kinase [Agathobaculum sp.]